METYYNGGNKKDWTKGGREEREKKTREKKGIKRNQTEEVEDDCVRCTTEGRDRRTTGKSFDLNEIAAAKKVEDIRRNGKEEERKGKKKRKKKRRKRKRKEKEQTQKKCKSAMRGKTGKCMYRYIDNEKTGKTDILLPYIQGWSDDDRREKKKNTRRRCGGKAGITKRQRAKGQKNKTATKKENCRPNGGMRKWWRPLRLY